MRYSSKEFIKVSRTRYLEKRYEYAPWYNDKSDFNTNAKSYYDYLARFNYLVKDLVEFLNRALNRNIEVLDTESIDLTKLGDWIDNGNCGGYDDNIKLKADVIISKLTEIKKYANIVGTPFTIKNGSKIKNDGVWSPDYDNVIEGINKELGNIKQDILDIFDEILEIFENIGIIKNDIANIKSDISKMKTDITNIKTEQASHKSALQKLIDNLYNSGAITTNNINTFTFVTGRNIATGNINLFGGTPDGSSFIRTSKGSTSNDISAGY